MNSTNNTPNRYNLDLTDCIQDTTANYTESHPELFQCPSDIFEDEVFNAIDELIEDFSTHPEKYLKSQYFSFKD